MRYNILVLPLTLGAKVSLLPTKKIHFSSGVVPGFTSNPRMIYRTSTTMDRSRRGDAIFHFSYDHHDDERHQLPSTSTSSVGRRDTDADQDHGDSVMDSESHTPFTTGLPVRPTDTNSTHLTKLADRRRKFLQTFSSSPGRSTTVHTDDLNKNTLTTTASCADRSAKMVRNWTKSTAFITVAWALLAMVTMSSAQESPFTAQPKESPYYVNEGDPGPTLECSVAGRYALDKSKYELKWSFARGNGNGPPVFLTDGDRNYKPALYDLVRGSSDGSYGLRIKKVSFANDNGQFYCSMFDVEKTKQHDARPAEVIVLVPPEPPLIADQPTSASREGDPIQTSCQSKNGNPAPEFKWVFNNQTEVPSEWSRVTNATRPGQFSTSVLSWRANPSDNNAYLLCRIRNKAMGPAAAWLEVETRRLNVEYAPRVTVGPVENYNVEQGRRATLTCHADANPEPAQYVWEQVGGGGDRWQTENVEFIAERKHNGEYTCRATNSVGSGQSAISVNVFYAPIIKVHPILNPAEGDDVVLQCDIDANPKVDSVRWEGPNGSSHDGERWTLDSVTRSAAGNYTCTAFNTLTLFDAAAGSVTRSGSGTTLVDIRHKPGRGQIIPSRTTVLVGEEVTLRCTSDDLGSPSAKFKWASPGKEFDASGNGLFTIQRAQLTDAGLYRCMPYNDVGNGEEGDYTLKVIEPARLVQMLPLEKFPTEGEQQLILECGATGHPAPNITWYKDGRAIDVDNQRFDVQTTPGATSCDLKERCSYPVTGRLVWNSPVEWNDKGQYRCEAHNGAGEPHPSDTTLRVSHAPVILNDRYPSDALAAVDAGSSATISCRVSARPVPSFRWFRNAEDITSKGGRYNVREGTADSSRDEYESVLDIRDTNADDFGPYMCRAVNGRGDPAEVIVQLQTRTKPHMPADLRKFAASYGWLVVGWAPGFNGGDDQQFTMERREVNPWTGQEDMSSAEQVTLRHSNMTTALVTSNGRRIKRSAGDWRSYVLYNVTNLAPLNTYWFRVMAANQLGSTEWTNWFTTTTEDVPIDPTIPAPEKATYHLDSNKLHFEPSPTPAVHCLMIYVQMEGQPMRSVRCVPSNSPGKDIAWADKMQVRMCRRSPPLYCSEPTPVLYASSLSSIPWAVILPVALVVVALMIVVCVVYLCCRMRGGKVQKKPVKAINNRNPNADYSQTTNERNRPKVISGPFTPISVDEVQKNTPTHGSQADSGVFTLNNGHVHPTGTLQQQQQQQQQQQYHQQYQMGNGNGYPHNGQAYTNGGLRSSFDEGVDRWGSAADPFDYSTDPYNPGYGSDAVDGGYYDQYGNARGVVDLNPQGVVLGPDQGYDDDQSSFTTPNSRRIMREIIV